MAPIATRQPASESRRTPFGGSIDTAITMPPAMMRKITCLRMNMSRDAPIRAATAGLAASIST